MVSLIIEKDAKNLKWEKSIFNKWYYKLDIHIQEN